MNPTTIRIIAGILFVVVVFIIVARRKRMASRRKPIPWDTTRAALWLETRLGFSGSFRGQRKEAEQRLYNGRWTGCASPKRRTPAKWMTWRNARFGLIGKILAMIVSLRHLLGWMVSGFRSREDLPDACEGWPEAGAPGRRVDSPWGDARTRQPVPAEPATTIKQLLSDYPPPAIGG